MGATGGRLDVKAVDRRHPRCRLCGICKSDHPEARSSIAGVLILVRISAMRSFPQKKINTFLFVGVLSAPAHMPADTTLKQNSYGWSWFRSSRFQSAKLKKSFSVRGASFSESVDQPEARRLLRTAKSVL